MAKGGAVTTGNTLALTVDAATGQVTDWGISQTHASLLPRLGTVTSVP